MMLEGVERKRRLWLLAVAVAVVVAAAVGIYAAASGGTSSSGDRMVWCVAPGEQVTPQLKAEYPELHMSKAACDAVGK